MIDILKGMQGRYPDYEPTGPSRDDMTEPVETMLRLRKQLPEVKTPHAQESLRRQISAIDKQIDALVYELHGLTEDETRIVKGDWQVSNGKQQGRSVALAAKIVFTALSTRHDQTNWEDM